MSLLLLAHSNLADDGTVTAGSALTTLPASNLQKIHLSTKWRSDASTSTYIDVDFGSSVTFGVLALLGTNLTSGATRAIALSDVSAGGTDVLNVASAAAGVSNGYRNLLYVFSQAYTARYLRLTIVDANAVVLGNEGTVAGYLTAGRLFVGPTFRPDAAVGYSIQWMDPSVKTRSRGGQIFSETKQKYRMVTFLLEKLTEAEAFTTVFELDRLRGSTDDVLAVIDPGSSYASELTVFGPQVNVGPVVYPFLNVWTRSFTIEERL